jgi:ribonuclease R
LRSRFFEGVMRSHARLTYGQAAAMLVDRDAALRSRYAPVIESLDALYDLYHAFDRARRVRGAIEFESTETRFIFDAARKIERIEPVVRNDAHKLIEECMVAANVAAARFLLRHKLPALYRVHPGVKPDKLEDLRAFLGEFGLSLSGGPKPAAGDYAKLLEKARARPDAHLIETVLLRSLSQAVYTPDNIGHFGLAHEAYTHFTSPIRRYPDLIVHRAIRHCLRNGKAEEFDTTHADLVLHGEHSSACERRADEATRDAVAWLKCEFMMDKLGEHFQGTVSAVTSFGLFIELDGIYVEGLVHISTLPGDYYHYDPVAHRLRGERSGRGFRLGDRLEVVVARVDLDERKLDLMLAGVKDEPRAATRTSGRRRSRR